MIPGRCVFYMWVCLESLYDRSWWRSHASHEINYYHPFEFFLSHSQKSIWCSKPLNHAPSWDANGLFSVKSVDHVVYDGWGHANLNTSCLIMYFVSRLCRKLPPFHGMTKKKNSNEISWSVPVESGTLWLPIYSSHSLGFIPFNFNLIYVLLPNTWSR